MTIQKIFGLKVEPIFQFEFKLNLAIFDFVWLIN